AARSGRRAAPPGPQRRRRLRRARSGPRRRPRGRTAGRRLSVALLLALAGGAAAFAVGFAVGRAGRRAPVPTAAGTAVAGPDPAPPAVSPTVAGVLEVHPTGVVIGGLDGEVEYRNAAAEAMAGTHAGVLIDEAVERHLELGAADDRAHEVVDLYGPPRTAFEVSSRALPDGRRVVFVADISEPRRIERIRT